MYNRDHGKKFVKSLSNYARKLYKASKSTTQRAKDKQEIRSQQ
jgi:hypothetical protein